IFGSSEPMSVIGDLNLDREGPMERRRLVQRSVQRSVMEKRKNYIGSAIVVFSFLVSMSAMAGTVFATGAGQNQDPSDGEYPPSSFGSPPVNGFSEGFAARQVIDMESSQDGS